MINPIIRKEVLSSLRTRKAIAMQAAFLIVAALLIWRHWPADGLQDSGALQARKILSVLAMGELAMVALFAPAFTAASLTSEREHNTLESLFFTGLRPWEIALGKITGSLSFLVLLVISGAPALALPFLLGGVSGTEVLAVVLILLLTAVYLGMIGLLLSSLMYRSYRAIIATYGVLLVVCFVFATPAWPVSRHLITQVPRPVGYVLYGIASLSPFEAMMSLVLPKSSYAVTLSHLPPQIDTFWKLFIPLSLLVIVIVTVVCLIKLRRPPQPPRPREGLKVVERGQGVTARSVIFLIDPRKRKRMIQWWQNPVLMKEFRTRPMLQAQWILRAIGACVILAIVLMIVMAVSVGVLAGQAMNMHESMGVAVAALIVVLLLLIGPAMTGGTVCGDLETGVWDLMRTTRLSSLRIVLGKFEAAVLPLLLLALSMLPALFILLYFDPALIWRYLRVMEVVGMAVLFVAVVGMFFSSIFKKTATATAWTYAVVITMGLASLLVLLDPEGFSDRLVNTVFLVNPVAVAMGAAGEPGLEQRGLLAGYLKIMGGTCAVLFAITVVRVLQLRRPD